MSALPRRQRILDTALRVSTFVSTLGLAGLFVTIALGFEEPNRAMLTASSCLLLTAPLAVLVHAVLTSHLTPARRRTWLRALVGPKALPAMSRYLRRFSSVRSPALRGTTAPSFLRGIDPREQR